MWSATGMWSRRSLMPKHSTRRVAQIDNPAAANGEVRHPRRRAEHPRHAASAERLLRQGRSAPRARTPPTAYLLTDGTDAPMEPHTLQPTRPAIRTNKPPATSVVIEHDRVSADAPGARRLRASANLMNFPGSAFMPGQLVAGPADRFQGRRSRPGAGAERAKPCGAGRLRPVAGRTELWLNRRTRRWSG